MQPSKTFIQQSTRKQFSQFSQLKSTTSKNELIILTSTGLFFNDFLQGQRTIGLGPQTPGGQPKIYFEEGCMLVIMANKENFGILDQLNGHIWHSVSLSTEPSSQTITQHFFSIPPDTEKLNKSSPVRLQAQIVPTCYTRLTKTFILISEQPTNTS